ncbi:uncharacterized protein LOC9302300 [Arabidopsis lyrata subsp. lyrata]|nr:uncharacterized protein LOC9302300 [Arabidopsis lyrata subsp. lyrata]|eukprot:XP_002864526.2 uncharacterized protein LOC9302300 [Arabidopsis lyrata subsp. lyrata]
MKFISELTIIITPSVPEIKTGYNYGLVSPVLGLLAYNSNPYGVAVNPYEINIMGTEQNSILIKFLNSVASGSPKPNTKKNSSLLCACFTSNGNITFREQVSASVFLGTRQGHYVLVIRAHDSSGRGSTLVTPPSSPAVNDGGGGKLAVGSVIGSMIGAFLLRLLVVAMVVKGKKKTMREEMERRAYEEEALPVSMVGHVRANPNASRTRTVPRLDNTRYSKSVTSNNNRKLGRSSFLI